MTRPTVTPTVTAGGGMHDDSTTTHPAFGVVELTRRNYGPGGTRLFGSDLQHHTTMSLTMREAVSHRMLNGDRVSGGRIVCELEFSLAQWAAFIASAGMGAGTHCTFNAYRDGDRLTQCPAIGAPVEAHVDRFAREMREQVAARTGAVLRHLAELSAMVEAGAGKAKLRQAVADATRHADQLSGSVGFINEQFEESIEHVVSAAKVEVEGFVHSTIMRTGIEALQQASPDMGLLSGPVVGEA